MRTLLALALLAAAFAAAAQSVERPRPPGTVPLDEPPPPPPLVETDPALEPQVTVRTEGEQKIEEFRLRGKLYMVRVTPKHGKPYVMIDQRGDGTMTRHDNPLDSGVRVPQWVLKEF